MLSCWTLEVRRCEKGENGKLGNLAAGITSRSDVDEMLIAIALKRQPSLNFLMPPTVKEGDNLRVFSFDGLDRVKRKSWAYIAIARKFSE